MDSQRVAALLGIWEKPVTENELDTLCKTYGVTLRRNKKGYEGYKRFGGKVRVKYLIGIGKLERTPESEIRRKLDAFLDSCKDV
jgi:hypothetical protein